MIALRRRELTNVYSRLRLLPPNNIKDVLYAGSILGRANDKEINDSRLRRELAKLFPVNFESFGVELYNISVKPYKLVKARSLELEFEQGHAFAIDLVLLQYGTICGALIIIGKVSISAPMFNLPEPVNGNMFNVFGLKKVFVSQLARIPGIYINSRGSEVEVSLTSAKGCTLAAAARGFDV